MSDVANVTGPRMTLRPPIVLVTAILVLGVGGCGGEKTTKDPMPTVDASPAQIRTTAPSGERFDEEAWRRQTTKRFGEEPEYADGSKLDYVDTARMLCDQEKHPDYEEGSLQAYMLETFCPNV